MADLAIDKTHIILVNALVKKDGKILISQRSWEESHEPGKWTIPGGKVERTEGDVWNVIEKTLAKEVEEETGVKIKDSVALLCNNTFIRSTGHHVVSFNFICDWLEGEPQALEDTMNVCWVGKDELNNFDFAPNVKKYLEMGFKKI